MWGALSSFNYQNEWDLLETEAKRNPKTALAKLEKIEKQAKGEKNVPEQLRCILSRMKFSEWVEEDVFGKCINSLQQFQSTQKDPAAIAMTRFAEAMAFNNFYLNNQWDINRRTALWGTVPSDMKEWPANIFVDTIHTLCLQAIAEPALKTTQTTVYSTLLNPGKDSRTYRPTLYDFLLYYCIENRGYEIGQIFTDKECDLFFADLEAFHKNDADKSAYVSVRIDRLKNQYLSLYRTPDQNGYVVALRQLIDEVAKEPASILVRIELANTLYNQLSVVDENLNVQLSVLDENLMVRTSTADVLKVCNDGIAAFPNHPQVKCLKSVVRNMNKSDMQLTLNKNSFHEGDKIGFKVSYANTKMLNLTLNRINCSIHDWNTKDQRKLPRTKVADYSFALEKTDYCIKKDTLLEIPAQHFGIYELVKGSETVSFIVSNLFVLALNLSLNGDAYYVVVDEKTGAPRTGVTACFSLRSWNNISRTNAYSEIGSAQTDKDGFANFKITKNYGNFDCWVTDGKDIYTAYESYILNRYTPKSDNATDFKVTTFTDRSIYRPGQTVYFKSVAYSISKKGVDALEGRELQVVLYDANHQKVGEQRLTTNAFGSVASSFVLPPNGLSGRYQLKVGYTYTDISVEEYKRPSFEVTLNRPNESYTFGDNVTVKGAVGYLLGTPVQNAKVAYTVTRTENMFFWWWRANSSVEDVVAEGELETNDKGEYEIHFVPEKGQNQSTTVCYDYVVLAKVTDANGETHEQSVRVTVADESMSIVCPNCTVVQPSELADLKFSVVNLNCEGIDREVSYKVFCNGAEVATGKVQSSAKEGFKLPLDTEKLKSGNYKVEMSVPDDKGRVVKQNFETILYRKTDNVPPVEMPFWFEDCASHELAEGETTTVRVGSSLHNAHLLVVTIDDNGTLEKQWYGLNNEIKPINFSLSNNSHLKVQFFLISEGKVENKVIEFDKKAPDTKIPVKLSVFRDKVQPGSTEKWTITLPSNKSAEVLATMYDASLDQIRRHAWSFSPAYIRYFNIPSFSVRSNNGSSLFSWTQGQPTDYFLKFDQWKDFFRSYGPTVYMLCEEKMAAGGLKSKAVMYNGAEESADYAFVNNSMGNAIVKREKPQAAAPIMMEDADDEEEQQQPHIRTNFAETAFFYPQLTSDKDGNVQLNFTMPESLTRWKLMALAHTADLYTGSLSQEVVSQKEFMVSPNYPRFLRNGDECVLSAKVINLGDAALKGSATLQLLDPVTEKVIVESTSNFELAAGQNSAVEWPVSVPNQVEALLVRVIAKTGSFSDAEQKLLPVLSSRVVLTQSLPMWVRGGKTKDFSLDNLVNNNSKTLSSRFLKLEMATNPVWYAVQALPSATVVEHDNAISLSAAYFASKLANHIAVSNPKIFKVIELWKQQSADKETLLSNLEKNQEVKNVLLNETPWVMDAKSETERKQRLATLFDLNTLSSNCEGWLKRLAELQTAEGGYSWFKDMPAGYHSTLFVLDNFGRLKKAGIDVSAQEANIKKAINFLDNQLREDYEWLVKNDKDYKKTAHIGMYELYYFQVRSLFAGIKVPANCSTAYNFYYGLMKKQWDQCSLYGKALAAISLYRGGDKAEALKVARSLREFSTSNDEMGMFWQKNVSSYYWQDAAISTHTRIMEALQVVDNNPAEQDELRVWLLNQKRTQNWDNTIANVDALNVLLLNGSDWLNHENQITVKMAGTEVKPEKTEVGTGYYSVVVPGNEVKPEMGKMQLASAEGDNLAWGALYWQFEEDIDKVKSNKTGLHIEKTVMLNSVENGKEVLKEVTNKTVLKVGDKLVVRLVLRTDRNLEYVSLKDQRASCLEPLQQISGYRYSDGAGYYQSAKDAAMYYFFSHLSKGTYVFEYPLFVTNKGDFSNGITTVQCLYAPEFLSNTGSVRIKVK